MLGFNFNRGTMVIIDFIRNGETHQTVRWSSDPTACPQADGEHRQAIYDFYASIDAEVISIRKVEFSEVCCTEL